MKLLARLFDSNCNVLFKSDGSFCLVCDDMFLYADGNDVRLVEEAGEFTYFVIDPTQDGALIRCKTANYQGKPQYLEVYCDGCLTCYGLNESNLPIYTFNFIPLD